jgi:diaminohydroxyphosphoribosylaminopyrimidine deaminase/5-amino-6-(5-phosphoribosylamino)uracil reductase
MQHQAQELNIGFISRMQRGRPWVRLKVASSLDGGTALANGVSQWITGAAARTDGQHWRARACAILTGLGTVLHDNPRLNVRLPDVTRQPLRVVVDSRLRTPPEAEILKGGALLVCADDARKHVYPQAIEILKLGNGLGQVDLAALLAELARRGINELHVEAGATLNGALLAQGLVDELLLYVAPRLLGSAVRGLFDIPALTLMEQATTLEIKEVTHLGQDVRIRARTLPSYAG